MADFRGTYYFKEASFSNAAFNDEIIFNEAHFKDRVMFGETTFNAEVGFSCVFYYDVIFWKTIFNSSVSLNSIFKSYTKFYKASFNNKFNLGESKFYGEVYFNSCIFKKEVDFVWGDAVIFMSNAYFNGSVFEDVVHFSKNSTLQANDLEIHNNKVLFKADVFFVGLTLPIDKSRGFLGMIKGCFLMKV